MAQLSISLLGNVTVAVAGQPVRHFRSEKVLALLIYLAVEAEQPHRRSALAGLLWPDHPEREARHNLSQSLLRLRQAIKDQEATPSVLLATRQTIQLNPISDHWLDVTAFLGYLKTATAGAENHSPDLQAMRQAVELYRGDFLSHFYLADSDLFEEWAITKREQLRQQSLEVLAWLVAYYEKQGEYEPAHHYAWRQVDLDPLNEANHRRLMRLLALSGQRNAALSQFETCRQLLEEELGIEPEAETTTLHRQIREGTLSRPPARITQARTVPENNLPLLSTPFVGREQALAELTSLLTQPQTRLVTIVGPGGMGKTRLAIEAASRQLETFKAGVKFVALAPVNPADFTGSINPLTATLAGTLGYPLRGGDTPENQLLAFLQDKEMLLVLDNFEHLVETAGFLSNLLSRAPQVKILVTSVVRLNLREEWLFTLAGMAIPTDEKIKTSRVLETSEVLASYDAVQLFWQRARQVQSDFDLPAHQAEVIRICQLVEGMPLGIELAATWVRQMPCQVIVREIEKTIDFLSTNYRNVPERQRSLRAVFDHSWQLLSEAERAIMQQLCVFRDGFQREAAEAITGASLFQLSTLVDKSLLQIIPSGRYNIHEGLRLYAEEKLQQNPALYEQVRDQHCRFYLKRFQQQEADLKGAQFLEARTLITIDIDNIRQAWRWAIERGNYSEIKHALESFRIYFEAQGWFLEGTILLDGLVAQLEPQSTLVEGTDPVDISSGVSSNLLAQAQSIHIWFRHNLGQQHAPTEEIFQKSIAILRSGGDRTRQETAMSLLLFGLLVFHKGQYSQAITLLRESCELFDTCDDLWGKGVTLLGLGQTYFSLGQYLEAERLSRESIAILNHSGERFWVTFALSTLGRIAQVLGRYAQAETNFQTLLENRLELGARAGVAFTLKDLGDATRLQGKYEQAQDYYQRSIELATETGLRFAKVQALWGLGSLALDQGDYVRAKQFFQQSREFNKGANAPGIGLGGPGWAALGLNDYLEAEHYFNEALQLAMQAQHVPLILDALTGLAQLLIHNGEQIHALELMVFILYHSTARQESKDRISGSYTELVANLPPEVTATAQAQGQERTLEDVLAEILEPDR